MYNTKELRLRDSIELANKSDEVNKLSLEIEALKNLSKEKLIFEKISNEANLIYPDLKEFKIYEKLGTNFNSTSRFSCKSKMGYVIEYTWKK